MGQNEGSEICVKLKAQALWLRYMDRAECSNSVTRDSLSQTTITSIDQCIQFGYMVTTSYVYGAIKVSIYILENVVIKCHYLRGKNSVMVVAR